MTPENSHVERGTTSGTTLTHRRALCKRSRSRTCTRAHTHTHTHAPHAYTHGRSRAERRATICQYVRFHTETWWKPWDSATESHSGSLPLDPTSSAFHRWVTPWTPIVSPCLPSLRRRARRRSRGGGNCAEGSGHSSARFYVGALIAFPLSCGWRNAVLLLTVISTLTRDNISARRNPARIRILRDSLLASSTLISQSDSVSLL